MTALAVFAQPMLFVRLCKNEMRYLLPAYSVNMT